MEGCTRLVYYHNHGHGSPHVFSRTFSNEFYKINKKNIFNAFLKKNRDLYWLDELSKTLFVGFMAIWVVEFSKVQKN